MAVIYIIRHAESEANQQEILASQLDYPLSSKGIDDASQIAAQFRQTIADKLDGIYSSPLKRAVQTAKPFADIFDQIVECIFEHFSYFFNNAVIVWVRYTAQRT